VDYIKFEQEKEETSVSLFECLKIIEDKGFSSERQRFSPAEDIFGIYLPQEILETMTDDELSIFLSYFTTEHINQIETDEGRMDIINLDAINRSIKKYGHLPLESVHLWASLPTQSEYEAIENLHN
jgi:hypothetical protein